MTISPRRSRSSSVGARVAVALFATVCAGVAMAASDVHVDGSVFKDGQGRVVILRGMNVAPDAKLPPFTPIGSGAQLDPLVAWGLDVVRLTFVWEAYEQSPGSYDAAYLAHFTTLVDQAWQRELLVIVDVHQDGFSRFQIDGCGSGFPVWTIPPEVTPDVPDNGPACVGWPAKMPLDWDMHTSWNRFYGDTHGARSAYLAMLAALAGAFVGHPGLLGYDLLNEPWGSESDEIAPLYEDAANAIRAVDPDAVLFVGPHATTAVGSQTNLPVPGFDNFAYAPHFYDPGVSGLGIWAGLPLDWPFWLMTSKAEQWNVPLFLGEFGAPGPTVNGAAYIAALYDELDQALASGAQWAYTPHWDPLEKDGWNREDLNVTDDTGALRPNFRIRARPKRVAGTPVFFTSRDDGPIGGRFVEFEWQHDPATGQTELFVPRDLLFAGASVQIVLTGEDLACGFDAGATLLSCGSNSPGTKRVKVRANDGCGLLGIEACLVLLARARRRRRA